MLRLGRVIHGTEYPPARDAVLLWTGRARLVCDARHMRIVRVARAAARPVRAFDVERFLLSTGRSKQIRRYRRGEAIFTAGDTCDGVLYIQAGGVTLSVVSRTGDDVVLAMLGPGEFFGEGCMTGQPIRMGRATAVTPCLILCVRTARMTQLLHAYPALSDRFIAHMISRNERMEDDLVAHRLLLSAQPPRAGVGRDPARSVRL